MHKKQQKSYLGQNKYRSNGARQKKEEKISEKKKLFNFVINYF